MKILKIKQNERIFADLFQYLWNNNMDLHGRLAQYTYEENDEKLDKDMALRLLKDLNNSISSVGQDDYVIEEDDFFVILNNYVEVEENY
ncbi:MAG: hypothetical protein ACOCP8_05010 [archaeon]